MRTYCTHTFVCGWVGGCVCACGCVGVCGCACVLVWVGRVTVHTYCKYIWDIRGYKCIVVQSMVMLTSAELKCS